MGLSIGIFWSNRKHIYRVGFGLEAVWGRQDFGRLTGLIVRVYLGRPYDIYNKLKNVEIIK